MKKLLSLLLALLALAGLTACGGGAKTVDIDALAADLTASGAFSDILNPPAEGVAARLYDLPDGAAKKVILYVSTGATAEEIFLAEAADSAAAGTLKTACQNRIEAQKQAFVNYAPEEVQKLDNAVLTTAGNYVILVVASDSAAAKAVVDKYA